MALSMDFVAVFEVTQNPIKRGGDGLSCQCATFFHLLVGKKQHRNIFSHKTGRFAKYGWILTYLKI